MNNQDRITRRRIIRSMSIRAGWILGIVAASSSLAQHSLTEEDQAIEQTRRSLEAGPREAPQLLPEGPMPEDVAPTARAPAIGPQSMIPSTGSLVREGVFLHNRQGRLVEVEGAWVFVFDTDAQGQAEAPMVMQRSIRLEEMAQLAATRTPTPTFVVSGTVFVYRGRNYLFPAFFTLLGSEKVLRAEGDGANTEGSLDTSTEMDPAVERLLEQMRTGDGHRRSIDPSNADNAEPDQERHLLREGQVLVHRVGRVVSGNGGYWTFVSDNGVDGTGDQPLRLLPCQNLMGIERVMYDRGGSLRFSLSGQVLVFEGHNYLIPTVYRLEQDRDGNTVAAH